MQFIFKLRAAAPNVRDEKSARDARKSWKNLIKHVCLCRIKLLIVTDGAWRWWMMQFASRGQSSRDDNGTGSPSTNCKSVRWRSLKLLHFALCTSKAKPRDCGDSSSDLIYFTSAIIDLNDVAFSLLPLSPGIFRFVDSIELIHSPQNGDDNITVRTDLCARVFPLSSPLASASQQISHV